MTGFSTATPRIAAYVMIEKDGKYAFLRRANTGWRDGYYGLPAGKVEKNESYTQAAVREAKEETGITIRPKDLQHVLTSHRYEDGSDWVDLLFIVNHYAGEVINAEPQVHSELAWLDLHSLPDDVNPSLHYMLDQYLAGRTYVEFGWS